MGGLMAIKEHVVNSYSVYADFVATKVSYLFHIYWQLSKMSLFIVTIIIKKLKMPTIAIKIIQFSAI